MAFGETIYYFRHFKRSRMYVFIEKKIEGSPVTVESFVENTIWMFVDPLAFHFSFLLHQLV